MATPSDREDTETVAGASPTGARLDREDELGQGMSVGRYVILAVAGSGGMGRVYRAYDPKLQREVALKLLRFGKPGSDGEAQAEARILREAQAMAKLSHPHVLPVFDVDRVGERLFIAMEFVEGETLRAWLRGTRRSWREIVFMFRQAGLGLAAAHAADLVHRDFKPANALVGTDGRVRVMDFGIARAHTHLEAIVSSGSIEYDNPIATDEPELSLSGPLTETGTVMGTPLYMSPEQHRGEPLDARSDQYSYCVALYEALYGERPFSQKGEALFEAKQALELTEPSGSGVPAWLDREVRRGLSPQPGDRFASMDDLLRALDRDPGKRLARAVRTLAAGAVLVGGTAWLVSDGDGDTLCSGARDKLVGVWDPARQDTLRRAFAASEAPFAEAASERVIRGLDEYAESWAEAREQACRATNVLGEQSSEVLDLRMACLDRQLFQLGALVEVLSSEVDSDVASRSIVAVAALAPQDACADVTALRARVTPPDNPELAQQVDTLRERLDHVRALNSAGKFAPAYERVRALEQPVRTLEYAPLTAEMLYWLAELEDNSGLWEQAARTFKESYLTAVAAQDDGAAMRAVSRLVFVFGGRLMRLEEAEGWADQARAWTRRRGGSPQAQASLHATLARVYYQQSRYDEALPHAQRAVSLREGREGAELRLGSALSTLGMVLRARGDYQAAREFHQRCVDIEESEVGETHPRLAPALINLGNDVLALGELDEASGLYQRAISILESLSPEHPELVGPLNNLALVYRDLERHDEALALIERTIAIREESYPRNHPEIAIVLENLGGLHHELGHLEMSAAHHQRAAALWELAFGPDHVDVALALDNLGGVLVELGRHQQATTPLERALVVRERTLGPDHRDVAQSLANLGALRRAEGDYDSAIAMHRRAVAIWERALGPEHSGMEPLLAHLAKDLRAKRAASQSAGEDDSSDLIELEP